MGAAAAAGAECGNQRGDALVVRSATVHVSAQAVRATTRLPGMLLERLVYGCRWPDGSTARFMW